MTVQTLTVETHTAAGAEARTDAVAVEEPLEIRIGHGLLGNRRFESVAVTMRTPGHDADLAVGFLWGEGILDDPADIIAVEESVAASVVRVDLAPGVHVDLDKLKRNVYVSSSCGVCGKTALDAVETVCEPIAKAFVIQPAMIHALPAKMKDAQTTFAATGGLHAAGLFDSHGELLLIREDVGRHNAVDKVVGHCVRRGLARRDDHILLVSGRASFELVQKAARLGVPVLAAVGAPSSLAVALAQRLGVTLLGFVRDGRFNKYSFW